LLTKDGYLYMALLHSKLLDFLSTAAFCCVLSTTDVPLLLPTDCQSIYYIFISDVFPTYLHHSSPPPTPNLPPSLPPAITPSSFLLLALHAVHFTSYTHPLPTLWYALPTTPYRPLPTAPVRAPLPTSLVFSL
jgi:hypothetical protein